MIGPDFYKFGLRLRPVSVDDAEFILAARRSPAAAPFLSYTNPSLSAQRVWLEKQRQREGDFYFIVETPTQGPVGTVGLYDIENEAAEWGRLIMTEGSPAALCCALAIFSFAFDSLQLHTVSSWTMANNGRTVAFHDRLALPRQMVTRNVLTEHGEQSREFAQHTLTSEIWPSFSHKWTSMAERTVRFL